MKPKIRIPFEGNRRITFKFGEAPDWYVKVFGYPHNGVDYGMKAGRLILACDDGVVDYADYVPDSNGCGVILKHDWGISLYWHLSRILAKRGDIVKKGGNIGHSGATGFVTGPHLHFGVKVSNTPNPVMRGWSDPLLYLEGVVSPPSTPDIEPQYYRVKFGDSLWKIAEKFYNEGALWRRIWDANKITIKDPAIIYPFQKLLIP